MNDAKLIAHARRLHDLAAARTGTRADLVALRDLVPQLLERFGALLPEDAEASAPPKKILEKIGAGATPVAAIRQAR